VVQLENQFKELQRTTSEKHNLTVVQLENQFKELQRTTSEKHNLTVVQLENQFKELQRTTSEKHNQLANQATALQGKIALTANAGKYQFPH
jgi:gluconate kinase